MNDMDRALAELTKPCKRIFLYDYSEGAVCQQVGEHTAHFAQWTDDEGNIHRVKWIEEIEKNIVSSDLGVREETYQLTDTNVGYVAQMSGIPEFVIQNVRDKDKANDMIRGFGVIVDIATDKWLQTDGLIT